MDKHDTLLLCSGSAENRNLLRNTLEERYHLLEARNEKQAMLLLEQNRSCIAAVLLDASGNGTADWQMPEWLRCRDLSGQIPVIVIADQLSPELLHTVFASGVSDVLPLTYETEAMLHRVKNIVELHLHKQYLETMLTEQTNQIRQSNETLVDALSSIIEHRSVESGQHILRIRHFTRILLEEVVRSCPEYQLDETVVSVISSAAALHDIGKISIPDSVLMKPGRLTEEEREVMKTHSATGCQILSSLGSMGDPEYMRYAHNICHYHHERWDGSGYPEGLSGDDIPICAQVVGLADVYDALTSKRVYKDAYPYAQAVNMILKGECGAFSPKLLECFKHVTGAFENLSRAYADGLVPEIQSFDTTLLPPLKQEENSLERVRAKYFALLHYIDGMLMEMDLNAGLLHLIYNPYPEMSWIGDVTSYEELISILDDRIVSEDSCESMKKFFREDIPEFLRLDLRRSSRHFRFRSQTHPEGDAFEITLLRTNPIDAKRKTLALLCRREPEEALRMRQDAPASIMADSTYLCCNDETYTLVQLGRHIPKLAGYSEQELKERFGNQLLELVLPEDRRRIRRSLQEQFARGVTAEVEFRIQHKDGRILWVLNKSRLSIGPDGREYLNSFLTDISHTKVAYDEISDKLRRYEIILAQTENVLFEWDMIRDTLVLSETWEKIFGFVPVGHTGREILSEGSYFHPDDLPVLIDHINNLKDSSHYEMVEARIATARGRYIWCRFRASAIRNEKGVLQKVVGIIINIDAEKQAERMLRERADRDALTKLLNKNAAKNQMEMYLTHAAEDAASAMIIIDLDNFKFVNDRYGHLFGDAVLTRVAREIEKLFRNQDIVARIGGDEFLVLMRGVSNRELLEKRCRQLLQNLHSVFLDRKVSLSLSCSIGIALSPEHGRCYQDLFRCADQALYQAKDRGKNCFVFFERNNQLLFSREEKINRVKTPIDSDVKPGLAEDNLVRHAFQKLYSSENVEHAVQEILALVGKEMNVSRVYVFENSDDNRFCSNTYEWCNDGIASEIDNLKNISYEEDIPGYQECFNEQDLLYCSDIRELPQPVYEIVAPQNIKSMLHCAIRERGVFRGYVGFDECVENRIWTKDQIQTLKYYSEMLSVFLLKHREHERSLRRASELQSVLDNQNVWIYVIDPDTCRLKFLNAKTRELAPDAQLESCCYRSLMGREERCPGCPSKEIRKIGNNSAVLQNCRFNMQIQAEATLIQWNGEESCLLTCRKLRDGTENREL